MVMETALADAGWTWPKNLVDSLDDYEKKFVAFEFLPPRTLSYYLARIDYLGFVNMKRVLDAGCGMGQWSLALAQRNEEVQGVDLSRRRIDLARRLASEMGVANCHFHCAKLESLGFPDESFDGIFCYGVFMFTQMPAVLAEIHRVLKPGGRFYINANSWGWYLHLLKDVPWNRRPALRMIRNTLLGRKQNIVVTESWLRRQLTAAGLQPIAVVSEGAASFHARPPATVPAPGYPPRCLGIRSIIETIGLKT